MLLSKIKTLNKPSKNLTKTRPETFRSMQLDLEQRCPEPVCFKPSHLYPVYLGNYGSLRSDLNAYQR